MKKFVVMLICLAVLAGCNKTINDVLESFGSNNSSGDENDGAVKLSKEIAYYNDYLGISYTIPRGWWLYEASGENLGESKGTITDDITMDIDYGKYESYAYSNIWLLSFGNLKESSQDNHLGFYLDAISLEGVNDMAGYMKYYETFMLEPTDDAAYRMTDSRQITIKGKPFELRDYLVSREEDNFQIMTLSCQVKQGYFFNMAVDYWPDNARAKQTIIDSITKAVEFF